MASPAGPEAVISPLQKADGSSAFSYGGYTVIASANGPIEAQRRDESPDEALIDVTIRPAAGVGGTRERQLESIIQSALRQLVLVKNLPRMAIQVTLQVTETPENDYVNTKLVQARSNLPIIPALLHAAMLGLLSAAVPMKATATAATLAISSHDAAKRTIADPSPLEVAHASSIHVLGFTSHDDLLFCESEGQFSLADWDEVVTAARKACCQPRRLADLDTVMGDGADSSTDLRQFVRSTMEQHAASAFNWKAAS